MAKTQEELNTIKEEVKSLNEKLTELTDKELEQVSGGLKLDPDRLRRKVEESVILTHTEKAKDKATEMKNLQSKITTSAGTIAVLMPMVNVADK